MTQLEKVLHFMVYNGAITPVDAVKEENGLFVLRLGAVVHVLRHKYGLNIKTEYVPNKTNKGQIARYWFDDQDSYDRAYEMVIEAMKEAEG